jgi:hypothetical protein
MSPFAEAFVTAITLIGAVALVSVIVSKKAQTPAVIQAAASGFGNVLGVAESPVTGSNYNINLSYPGSDFSASFGHA